jgi:hypothetical protein
VRFAGDLSDRNLQFSGLSPDGTKFYTYSNGYNIEHSFNNLKFFEFRGLLYESPK